MGDAEDVLAPLVLHAEGEAVFVAAGVDVAEEDLAGGFEGLPEETAPSSPWHSLRKFRNQRYALIVPFVSDARRISPPLPVLLPFLPGITRLPKPVLPEVGR